MMTRHGHKDARGFTLIELLVGLAIFTTIMAGVTVMFNSAVRTTKQGYQNQRAFENVRGAFALIEEDLTRSFGSRSTGHKHTFYGAPFGFTFIGLVSTEGGSNFNTARITYVVYGQADSEGVLTKRFATQASDATASTTLNTYSLIRYVEPKHDDLDTFPIDWTSGVSGDSGLSLVQTMADSLRDADRDIVCATDPGVSFGSMTDAEVVGYALNQSCYEEVLNAIKRELWLRMLAGDKSLPRFWDTGEGGPVVRIGSTATESRDPADYVVAENLLHIDRTAAFDLDNPDLQANYVIADEAQDPFGTVNPKFIDSDGNADGYDEDMALIDYDGSSVDYQNFVSWYESFDNTIIAYSPTNYFFAYREYDAESPRVDENGNAIFVVDDEGVLLDGSGGFTLQQNELAPRLFAFWNDVRNLAWNRFLNDYTVDNSGIAELQFDDMSTVPDILDPALPESILLEFAVFYPSAYPGAPDFQRVFSHRINLPTAFRRKSETLWTRDIRNAEGR